MKVRADDAIYVKLVNAQAFCARRGLKLEKLIVNRMIERYVHYGVKPDFFGFTSLCLTFPLEKVGEQSENSAN